MFKVKGFSEYKMRESFCVPQPCFDHVMGHNMHKLLHGANIDKTTFTLATRPRVMNCNLLLTNHYYVATPSKSP
jgi:hypothetical protein